MFPHPRVAREGTDEAAPQPSPASANAGSSAAASASSPGGPVGTVGTVERLSLMELMVAELGGWASAVFYRCHLPAGPFLASDGVVHMDLAVFCGESQEQEAPSAP